MRTYTLSNGQKVDMQGFVEAIRSLNKYPLYFFDTTMGNVCQVESRKAVVGMVDKIGKGRRYIPIAQFKESGYKSLMGQFIKGFVSSKVSPSFAKSLKTILQKKGWKAVIKAFEADEGEVEWFLAWDQFTYEEALDFAGYQLSSVCPQEAFDCQNCPICQAMRE